MQTNEAIALPQLPDLVEFLAIYLVVFELVWG
jgi:hypothetical protein